MCCMKLLHSRTVKICCTLSMLISQSWSLWQYWLLYIEHSYFKSTWQIEHLWRNKILEGCEIRLAIANKLGEGREEWMEKMVLLFAKWKGCPHQSLALAQSGQWRGKCWSPLSGDQQSSTNVRKHGWVEGWERVRTDYKKPDCDADETANETVRK